MLLVILSLFVLASKAEDLGWRWVEALSNEEKKGKKESLALFYIIW